MCHLFLLFSSKASDGDVLEENRNVTYFISEGNGAGKFAIDAITGVITLIDTIDYELEAKEYNLVVVARNTEEPYLEGEANVTVVILVRYIFVRAGLYFAIYDIF